MDLTKIISALRKELESINIVMEQLERLAAAQGKVAGKTGKLRKPFSPATRQRMAAAQKRRWAAVRKQKLLRPAA